MCLSFCNFSKKDQKKNSDQVIPSLESNIPQQQNKLQVSNQKYKEDLSKMQHFLIGDVGGTNSRLQLVEVANIKADPIIIKTQIFSTQKASSLESLIEEFLSDIPTNQQPKDAHLGLAGPIIDSSALMQNAKNLGRIKADDIQKKFKFRICELYNDFVIASYAILKFNPQDMVQINKAVPVKDSIISICGPGTGLGRSNLVPQTSDRTGDITYKVWPCEGGSASFPCLNQQQFDYYNFLKKHRQEKQIILEHGVTGLSIPYMYLFMKEQFPQLENTIEKKIDPKKFNYELRDKSEFPNKDIFDYGKNNKCQVCKKVFDLFYQVFQNLVGDIILQTLPYSGLYIIGNMAQSLKDHILANRGDFLKEYLENRSAVQIIFDRVPIYIVNVETELGLEGAKIVGKQSLQW